jgi:TP901 family phage tail tape measure protein
MAGLNVINVTVNTKDTGKAERQSIKSDLKTVGDEADKADTKTSGFGARLAKVGAAAAAGIATAAVGIGKALYDVGATMDEMEDKIRVGTGASGAALQGLVDSAKRVGTSVPSDFSSVGDAVTMLNQRLGMTGKPLEDMAAQMLNLSRITGTDLKGNIESATRVFQSWGIEAAQQPKFLDEIFRAAQQSGVGVDKLTASLGSAGPQLRAMGFSAEESMAMLAQFEKTGVDADSAMGALRMAVGKLGKAHEDSAKSTDAVNKAQKNLNETLKKHAAGSTEVEAAQNKLKEAQDKAALSSGSARDILNDYIARIKEAKTPIEAAGIAQEIFGKKGGVMADAIRSGRLNIDAMVESISKGTDTINKASLETMDFGEQWQLTKNRLMVAFQPAAAKVFAAIGDAMEQNGPKIAKMAEQIGPLLVAAIQIFITTAQTALPIIQAVAGVLTTLGPAAGPFLLVLGGIASGVKGFQTLKGALDLLPASFSKVAVEAAVNFAKMTLSAVTHSGASIAAAVAATGAWIAANAAMILATGGIILAIGAVIAIVVLVVKHWDWCKAKAKEIWDAIWGVIKAVGNGIVAAVKWVVDFVTNLFLNFTIVGIIIKHWDGIKRAFSEGARAAIGFVRDMIGAIGSIASEFGHLLVDAGRSLIQGLWRGISAMGSWLKSQIIGFIKSFVPGPVLRFLGISSDSKMFIGIGKNVGSGLATGILRTVGMVRSASSKLANAVPFDSGATFRTGTATTSAAVQTALAQNVAPIVLKLQTGGGNAVEEFLAELIKRYVRIQGGDVQQVFGQ